MGARSPSLSPPARYVCESVLQGWARQALWLDQALGALRDQLEPQLQQLSLDTRGRALGGSHTPLWWIFLLEFLLIYPSDKWRFLSLFCPFYVASRLTANSYLFVLACVYVCVFSGQFLWDVVALEQLSLSKDLSVVLVEALTALSTQDTVSLTLSPVLVVSNPNLWTILLGLTRRSITH